jgi:hypothetical protein
MIPDCDHLTAARQKQVRMMCPAPEDIVHLAHHGHERGVPTAVSAETVLAPQLHRRLGGGVQHPPIVSGRTHFDAPVTNQSVAADTLSNASQRTHN